MKQIKVSHSVKYVNWNLKVPYKMIKELVVLGWLHDFKFKEKRARNSIAESQTLLSARIEIYLHDILLEVNKPHSIESICWNTGLPLNIFCLTSCTLLSARVEMKIWFYIAVINFVVLYWVRELKSLMVVACAVDVVSHSIVYVRKNWNKLSIEGFFLIHFRIKFYKEILE